MNKFISSWDDGTKTDLQLAKLLKKYHIPAIFYIKTTCELSLTEIRKLSEDFEIGGHTSSHPQDLKLLNDVELKDEIEDNKLYLEQLIGKKITSFCYPRGRFDARVKKAVEKAGFKEARTVKVFNIKEPDDPFETNTTLHLTYPRAEYNGKDVFQMARQCIDEFAKGKIEYLHFWGHSNEANRFKLFSRLESLFTYIDKEINNKQ
jgi:peptidoglycan/xylan/chitin deacetylase (PgdA/CDA1 family)